MEFDSHLGRNGKLLEGISLRITYSNGIIWVTGRGINHRRIKGRTERSARRRIKRPVCQIRVKAVELVDPKISIKTYIFKSRVNQFTDGSDMGVKAREESRLTQGYSCHKKNELGLGIEIRNFILDVLSSRYLLDNQVGMLIRKLEIGRAHV